MAKAANRQTGGTSWGRLPGADQQRLPAPWRPEALPACPPDRPTLLPYGLGRSYGDSCLNPDGCLLPTTAQQHLIGFDPGKGLLECEGGVSLDTLLRFLVPRGWFLPVVPGTKFATVGGAIANDIHGKNHHGAGTFGCHVRGLELLRSDGSRRWVAPDSTGPEERDWFSATVGGLGLTGLITRAAIQCIPIRSATIRGAVKKLPDLDAFIAETALADSRSTYTVAWLDCLAGKTTLGRGLWMSGDFGDEADGPLKAHRTGGPLRVPVDFPDFVLNRFSIRAFNTFYYHRVPGRSRTLQQHYKGFFFPLDTIDRWNRIYGRRGFFQYQTVVPFSGGGDALRSMLEEIRQAGEGSFLGVLKAFGDRPSPGWLSFPQPGYTLALDFPNRGQSTLALFERLDAITRSAGGRLYPAKDARMPPELFREAYPQLNRFIPFMDPAFGSGFSRRMGL
ncbi:MAG: FAD-binding oxidoreductase [Opitutales bacterium]